MQLETGIKLIKVDESDIVDGVFENSEITEIYKSE